MAFKCCFSIFSAFQRASQSAANCVWFPGTSVQEYFHSVSPSDTLWTANYKVNEAFHVHIWLYTVRKLNMWHIRRSFSVKVGCCVWKSSSFRICDWTYIITYSVHTHNANTRLCVHNNVMSYSKSSLWPPKGVKPFLNLNPGKEVGPYLFPVPVLFLLRDLCFEIVHPDNDAVVGIVHCISFFQAVLHLWVTPWGTAELIPVGIFSFLSGCSV